MSGFPKIWTLIMNDPWFVSLPAIGRSIFLQLIITAKLVADTGEICYRSIPALAGFLGTDRKTLTRWLGKFETDGKIMILEKSPKSLRLKLTNYLKWQVVTSPKKAIEMAQGQGKNPTSLLQPGIHQTINQPIKKSMRKRREIVRDESPTPTDEGNGFKHGSTLYRIANPLEAPDPEADGSSLAKGMSET